MLSFDLFTKIFFYILNRILKFSIKFYTLYTLVLRHYGLNVTVNGFSFLLIFLS